MVERYRCVVNLDPYTEARLNVIMESGLFLTKSEAVKAMIVEFAQRVEDGEFSKHGRKL